MSGERHRIEYDERNRVGNRMTRILIGALRDFCFSAAFTYGV